MISEGSCDNEYWVIVAENSVLPSEEKKYFLNIIKQKTFLFSFYCIFDQISADMVRKKQEIYWHQTFELSLLLYSALHCCLSHHIPG